MKKVSYSVGKSRTRLLANRQAGWPMFMPKDMTPREKALCEAADNELRHLTNQLTKLEKDRAESHTRAMTTLDAIHGLVCDCG